MYYIMATSVVMAAAALLAALWPGLEGKLNRIVAWIILVPALLILVALGLGLCGRLTPGAMLLSHVGILIVLIVPWWKRHAAKKGQPEDVSYRDGSMHRPAGRMHAWWGPVARPWLWVMGAAWAAALGWMTYAGLLMPPFGSDAVAYHLPPAVWWLQAGRIYPVPSQFTFGYGYPQGMSLLMLWQLAYTATDHLVNVIQVPFVVLGVLAAYGLAREAGIGRPWAWWAAAFFGLTPIVLEQAVVPYTDVAVAALTLAALYLVFRFRRSGESGYLWLAGVAVGLILSIKANGFLVAGIVGLLALVPSKRRRPLIPTVGLAIVALGVPALGLAGYWYIRNLVLYHNPLFPAAIKVLGHTVFPGPRTIQNLLNVTPGQTPWQSFLLALHEHSHWYTYDSPNGGFGPAFTILGIGAIAAAGLHALVSRRWWIVFQLGAGIVLLVLQPFKYPRYILFLPAVAGVAFAYVVQRMARRRTRWFLQAMAAVLMLLTLVAVPYQPQLSAETFLQVRSQTAAGRPPSAATFGLARDYAFIDTIPELNHPDNRIAYTEAGYVYALMGQNRSNRVYYVPASNADEWVRKLKDAQTTFVIIGDDRATELRWLKQHPEDFVLWSRTWPYSIYVLRSDLPRNQALLAARGGGGQ
jgi:4-amino-4-deoxy-L-arabinose transferase-like glycosyltransferase